MSADALREPPESGTPVARRGLLVRDGLFLLAYALQGVAAFLFAAHYWALAGAAVGVGLSVVGLRTWLKPPRTFWERATLER